MCEKHRKRIGGKSSGDELGEAELKAFMHCLGYIDMQLSDTIHSADIEKDGWRYHFVKTINEKTTPDRKAFFLGYIGWEHWAIRRHRNWYEIALLEKNNEWTLALWGILALSLVLSRQGTKRTYHYGTGRIERAHKWYLDGCFDENKKGLSLTLWAASGRN